MWLEIARVQCPDNLSSFDIVVKSPTGQVMRTITVTEPIRRNGDIFVSYCRDLPPPPPVAPSTAAARKQ